MERNGNRPDYTRHDCIHQIFEAQAERTPGALAAVFENKRLTYRELNRKANQLAHYLKASGVGPEILVGICMERSLEMLIGILGILKAGGAYVPLDPAYPKERLGFILQETQATALLTRQRLIDDSRSKREDGGSLSSSPFLSEVEGLDPRLQVICLDTAWQVIDRETADNPATEATSENAAYVIFTSGSTGQPKGVIIEHRSLVNYNEVARAEYALGPKDRVLQFAPMSFDASVEEIFPTLTSGATLLPRTDAMLDPVLCLRKCAEWSVSVLSFPTAYWHEIYARLAANEAPLPPSLRLVIVGGERVLPRSVTDWRASAGRRVRLVNTYGPTEATVIATLRDVSGWAEQDDSTEVPIGRPIANTRVYLLDGAGQRVPPGVVGELCISGAGLSRGYLGRPDLTAEKFIPNPFGADPGERLYRTGDLARYLPDGNLEFAGRVDDQVKIRGFRVEPKEIEAALEKHPNIRQAIVVARQDTPAGRQLAAYFVAHGKEIPTAGELRSFLAARLPDYMVPFSFVNIGAIPLLPNGKVNRRALPAPDALRSAEEGNHTAPRTALEQWLVEKWQELLSVENVGIFDNFFELGGDSLTAARFINRLQTGLGQYVYVIAIFDAPTVADFARYLCRHYPDAVEQTFGPASFQSADGRTPSNEPERVDASKVDQMRRLISPLPHSEVRRTSRNPRAIFILSPPRSGSTLLRVMLAGHPRLFAPQELDLLSFNTLEERKGARLDSGNVGFLEGTVRAIMEIKTCDMRSAKKIMEGYERQKLTTKDFYRLMQEWIGDRTLVDKSTSYALDVGILERAERDFDSPLYIHLLRHPYGMIHSFENARMDQVFFRNQDLFDVRQLAELVWLICHQNISQFLKRVPECRRRRVKFEDLVHAPRPQLEAVCRFLGLDFDPEVLEPYKDTEKRMTDGIHTESRMVGDVKFHQHSAINPRVADEWQGRYENDFLGDITWQLAESLGYRRSSNGTRGDDNRHGMESITRQQRDPLRIQESNENLQIPFVGGLRDHGSK